MPADPESTGWVAAILAAVGIGGGGTGCCDSTRGSRRIRPASRRSKRDRTTTMGRSSARIRPSLDSTGGPNGLRVT